MLFFQKKTEVKIKTQSNIGKLRLKYEKKIFCLKLIPATVKSQRKNYKKSLTRKLASMTLNTVITLAGSNNSKINTNSSTL